MLGFFSAGTCFVLIFLCCCLFWCHPRVPQHRSPTSPVALLVSLLRHGQSWSSHHTATPLTLPKPKPTGYAQLRCEGHPEGSPWAQPGVVQPVAPSSLPVSSTGGTALSQRHRQLRRYLPISASHSLRHASMPWLVKICQKNPLNPQRKDFFKVILLWHKCCMLDCVFGDPTYDQ